MQSLFKKKENVKNKQLKKILQDLLGKIAAPEATAEKPKPNMLSKEKSHIHSVDGETNRAKGHKEQLTFYTGRTITTKDGHVHEYNASIESDGKILHRLEGVTGSAIKNEQDHYHEITGRTSLDDQHTHRYEIQTSGITHKVKRRKQPGTKRYASVITPVETDEEDALPVEE